MQNVYSYEEAFSASLEYFNDDKLAAKVFLDKYALKNREGDLLEKTPTDMHWRLAEEFARVEKKKFKKPLSKEVIFSYFDRFRRIVPQGSPMYAIGNDYSYVSAGNCFILASPDDSYGGIHLADEMISQISKRRGGCGFDISKLRPKGALTTNAAKTSTGIIPFLERFNNSIKEVGQSGRRGACLVSLSVHHPEVIAFTKSKGDLSKITGANISIQLTNEFLQAVKDGKEYEQRWPVDSDTPVVSQMVDAKSVWKEIIKNAWSVAEPGLLFIDTIRKESPADCYSEFGFKTLTCNPCGEIPASANDSCRLLLLNLFSYVLHPFTNNAEFDFMAFEQDAKIAQRFMDDLVDLEIEKIDAIIGKIKKDPEEPHIKRVELDMWKNIKSTCLKGRRTGTGITALGDTLAALGLKYDSKSGIEMVGEIYKTLKLACYRSSMEMAKELGTFEMWDAKLEKDCSFLLRIKEEDPKLYKDLMKYGRRNIALLTTAPCGSVSILTQTTSGIEPVFLLEYTRRKKININDQNTKVDFVDKNGDRWQEFSVYHSKVQMWKDITGKEDLSKSPWHGCTAMDIDWQNRIKLQAIATQNVDHAISSTLNLPNDVSEEEVAKIYETAWESGCKGVTVYRDGCRDGVMVSERVDTPSGIAKHDAPKRPKELPCDFYHVTVKGQQYMVIVGLLGGEPYEVFAGKNGQIPKSVKKGKIVNVKRGHYRIVLENNHIIESIIDVENDEEEAMTRMISCTLRHGADIAFVVHQLEKTKGELTGFSKSVARTLKRYIPDGKAVTGEVCKECGGELTRECGCIICRNCGFSKCS